MKIFSKYHVFQKKMLFLSEWYGETRHINFNTTTKILFEIWKFYILKILKLKLNSVLGQNLSLCNKLLVLLLLASLFSHSYYRGYRVSQ